MLIYMFDVLGLGTLFVLVLSEYLMTWMVLEYFTVDVLSSENN